MKKGLLRTCAGVLAALMLIETAFTGNLSARVYAGEVEEVYEEVVDETAEEAVQTLSEEEEVIVTEEETVSEQNLADVDTVYSIYFNLDGGTLATNPARLLDARYNTTDGSKTIRQVIEEQVEFADGEEIENAFVPQRVGYEFNGWIDEEGNDFDFDSTLDSNVTATAMWIPKKTAMSLSINITNEPEIIHQYDVVEIISEEPNAQIYYKLVQEDVPTSLYDENVAEGYNRYIGKKTIRDIINCDVYCTESITIEAKAVKEGCPDVVETRTIIIEPDWGDISPAVQASRFDNDLMNVKPGIWVDGVQKYNTYQGKAITFEDVSVYCGTKLLEEGVDYTLSYVNNVNAYELTEGNSKFDATKAPALVVSGKGNYGRSYSEYFVIKKVNVNNLQYDDLSTVYNGDIQKLVPKFIFNDKYLKNGTDYKVTYPETTKDYKAVGEYGVKVVGAGNYTGTVILTERIASKSFLEGLTIDGVCNLVFNPDYEIGKKRYWVHSDMDKSFKLKLSGKTLIEGRDYKTVYDIKPPKVGTTSVQFIGIGDYAGTQPYEYEITDGSDSSQFNLGNAYIEGFMEEFVYDARPCDQSGDIKVYKGKGQTLLEYGKDYTIEVKGGADNINVGEVTIVIRPLKTDGAYYGYKELTFNIVPRDINNKKIIIKTGNVAYLVDGLAETDVTLTYDKSEYKISDVPLELNKDYTVSFINNTHTVNSKEYDVMDDSDKPTVTIKGKGNYKGTASFHYMVEGTNFYTVRLNPLDKAYVAKENNYKTTVNITDAKGNTLKAGRDYDKDYKYYYVDEVILDNGTVRAAGSEVVEGDMVPYGTCLRVEIKPLGSYAKKELIDGTYVYDTISATFRISGYNIEKAKVTILPQYYKGHEVTLDSTQIDVIYGTKTLSENDYEIVGYKRNSKAGTAIVTLRGIGDYFGTVDVEFTILKEGLGTYIRFNANGNATGTMANQYVTTYGTTTKPVLLTKNAFKRNYYEFVGWNTESDGSGIDIANNVPLYALDSLLSADVALQLYAVWKPIEYTITIYPNGGNFDESLIPAKYTADTVIEQLAVPDISTWPKGYMFGGWYAESYYQTRVTGISKGSHGNLNLFAKWVAYTYTITYNSNAPTGKSCATKMASTVISYGETKALSTNKFSISGYAFDGWSTNPEDDYGEYCNGQKVSEKDFADILEPQNNINGNVTLYAVWRKTYSVCLNVDAADATINDDSFEYTYGKGHSLETPVRPGYTFAGWYTDNTYKTKVASISSKAASDYSLIAKWTPISYSVTFNKNASKNISGTMSSITCKYGVEKNLPTNKFVRKGYEFIGWNTKSDKTGSWYLDGDSIEKLTTKAGAKITLYAQWHTTSYSINYHDNGGTRTTSGPSSYTFGSVETLPIATKTGYIFGGWYKEPTYKNKISAIKATSYGDLDLYAKWTADKNNLSGRSFTLTVVKDPDFTWKDGYVIPDTYTYGSSYTLPAGDNAPSRYGYNFAGWYTTPDYSKKITTITTKTYDDITLYAKWTPKTYSVIYKVNVPEGVNLKTVTGKDVLQKNFKYEVETALKKNTFKIKGYTFLGWSLDPDGLVLYSDTQKIKGANDSGDWVCEDETLYAIWEKDVYSIKYMNVTGITNNNPDTYDVDDEITLVSPQCIGKTFKGWYLDAGFTKRITQISKLTTGNKILYAKWTSRTYNIKYSKNDDNDSNTKIYSGLIGFVTNYFKKVSGGYILPSAERKGYKFLGWSTSSAGTDPVFALKSDPTADMTLYASWEAEVYKIKYDYGYNDKKVEKTYSISKKDQSLIIPTRYGYEFIGWRVGSKTGDFYNDPIDDEDILLESTTIFSDSIGDLELFAQWEPIKFHVEYNLNGGKGNCSDEAEHYCNDYFYLASAPKNGDKTFAGWKTSSGKIFSAGAKVNAEKLGYDSSITYTLTAVWQ